MSLRKAILDVVQPQKIEEGEDVYDKFGIQITKTRLKGGIGYQINYGERGRYIQVLSKDMNNLMKRANFESQKAWESSDENIYGASIFGVFDLAGNVSEWLDIEQNNTSTSQIVGGSWQDSSYIFDISINEYLPLTFHSSNVGFRCVK